MSDYWPPFRAPRYIQRMIERQEAEERDKHEWISDVKKRLGLVTIDDNPAGRGWHAHPGQPDWPAVTARPTRYAT